MKFKLLTTGFLSFLLFSCNTAKTTKFETDLNSTWELNSSTELKAAGSDISKPDFAHSSMYKINLPSTVFNGLVQTGKYKDIYYSNNLENIPTQQFEQSWWYRKEFQIESYEAGENYELLFEGINYKANIWLNGQLVADSATIAGPFRMFRLDITKYAKSTNTVAIEVFPPSKTDLTIGFVDWNPNTPDKNMGLWRGVKLCRSGAVAIRNIAITSTIDLENYSQAALNLDIELVNKSDKEMKGIIKSQIGDSIQFEIPYQLQPKETKRLKVNKNDVPALLIRNPRLWWPVNMGSPELYNAEFSIYDADNQLSHSKQERFGIRQISDFTFKEGNEFIRGYKINGKRILIRGGGWVDDMTLADNDEKVRAQVEYVKHMNLNTIRLEGFWGNSKAIYDACDENGILLMIGLSCQWEWKGYSGREETSFMSVETDSDMELISTSFQDQVKWGMNNPSIFLWVYGSDKLPSPKFETRLNGRIKEYDTDRCILASCKNRWQENNKAQVSAVSGNSGSKMLGPYEIVPPVYWYENKNLGGAYGFNTETGPGAQVPPIESIRKMLKPEDVDSINNAGWQYHCGRNEFKNLNRFLENYNQRYWKSSNAEEFAFNVQMSNYETMRSMYEAFEVNRNGAATGIVQWMLNSAWPEMYWQLYDWYLNPNGAFYGAKTACQPYNVIYNYQNESLYWSNNSNIEKLLNIELNVYDIHSKLIYSKTESKRFAPYSVEKWHKPVVNATSNVYFIALKLRGKDGVEVANNFYWLSAKKDKVDYTKSTWFYSPQTVYANFGQLKELPTANLSTKVSFATEGKYEVATVTLTNKTNKIAFFNELRIVDAKTKSTILPVFWSDNYISLLPGEVRTLSARYKKPDNQVSLVVKGFNSTIN